MTPSPIAPAPPRSTTDGAPGTRPDAGDGEFAAALQHTQPGKDAQAAAHAAGGAGKAPADAACDPAPAADVHGKAGKADPAHPTRARKRDHQDDSKTHASGTTTPGVVPPAPPPSAAPTRQAGAANGKPVPAGALVATTSTASARPSLRPSAARTERSGSVDPAAHTLTTPQQVASRPPGANPPASATASQLPDASPPQTTVPAQQLSGFVAARGGRVHDAWQRNGAGNHTDLLTGNPLGPLIQPLHGGVQATGPAPGPLTLPSAPGQPQFAQHLTQQVAWLVGNHIQQAEIQLNPRALGPIRIDVSTHHDHVDVSFAVQNPQTVQALQQTLPQLANLLAQHGLNLGQASVGQQAPGQQHAPPAAYPGGRWHDAEVKVPVPSPRMRHVALGRVDEFA